MISVGFRIVSPFFPFGACLIPELVTIRDKFMISLQLMGKVFVDQERFLF